MTEREFVSSTGLELDAPAAGDVVTVLVRPPSKTSKPVKHGATTSPLSAMLFGLSGEKDRGEHEDPNHYRVGSIWRVVAVNGAHAVVENLSSPLYRDCREIWAVAHHRWFDASELWEAMQQTEGDQA